MRDSHSRVSIPVLYSPATFCIPLVRNNLPRTGYILNRCPPCSRGFVPWLVSVRECTKERGKAQSSPGFNRGRTARKFMNDKPVALVTGANQGIGLQIAKDLAAHGFTVLVGSRNFERGEAAAKEVGPDGHALQLDVTDQASITAAAARVRNEFGRLDIL